MVVLETLQGIVVIVNLKVVTLYFSRRHLGALPVSGVSFPDLSQILIVIKHFNTSTHAPKTPSSPVNTFHTTDSEAQQEVGPRLLQKRGPEAMLIRRSP